MQLLRGRRLLFGAGQVRGATGRRCWLAAVLYTCTGGRTGQLAARTLLSKPEFLFFFNERRIIVIIAEYTSSCYKHSGIHDTHV